MRLNSAWKLESCANNFVRDEPEYNFQRWNESFSARLTMISRTEKGRWIATNLKCVLVNNAYRGSIFFTLNLFNAQSISELKVLKEKCFCFQRSYLVFLLKGDNQYVHALSDSMFLMEFVWFVYITFFFQSMCFIYATVKIRTAE